MISYCIGTLDRGFDIINKVYDLLLGICADSMKLYIGAQHWITSGLWLVTRGLATFRASCLVCLLVASRLLVFGLLSKSLRLGLVTDRFQSVGVFLANSPRLQQRI